MYTNLRNVQILISLLKQHNIKRLVLSPGTRNTPFTHSVENDSFFECFSLVDERSAAYFALGLAESYNQPVCVCCTSSTATCNYAPAMREAFERNIPLVALTSDRDMRCLYQMEDQMIDQNNMFGEYTKCCVNLPIVTSQDDEWYCVWSVNKALLEINHNGVGPIQINFQVKSLGDYSVKELPIVRKIERLERNIEETVWSDICTQLKEKKRILVLCGQNKDYLRKSGLSQCLEEFCNRYNAVISYDTFSNLDDQNEVFTRTEIITETMSNYDFLPLAPDLVITIGGGIWSFIKARLRETTVEFEHWRISNDGNVVDGFRRLTKIFQMPETLFFEHVLTQQDIYNDQTYSLEWKNAILAVKWPDLGFTNFKVIQEMVRQLPDNALLHLSVLNSIRLTNICNPNYSIKAFANIGADGIDGCFSTFIGQAKNYSDSAFLITGDLSFLYDLNASLQDISNNVHVLVINNFAGGEFHTNFGLEKMSSLNDFVAAGHTTKIQDCVAMMDFEYMCAHNLDDYLAKLPEFVSKQGRPVLFEVFTNADSDAKALKSFYSINKKIISFGEKVMRKIKKL